MALQDDLGNRMKSYYEHIPQIKLMRRCPVIIRIDGKAFHSFTRGFERPFDDILIQTMQETAKYLCENIQGCVLAYTQSDEISLLLVDYKTLNTSAWFDYEVQKVCSISASMATMAFNNFFGQIVEKELFESHTCAAAQSMELQIKKRKYMGTLRAARDQGAMFDARCFNIPKEEVTNYFYWRQMDATRNSIQMVGRAYFSHKDLHCKNSGDIQDMLMLQKGVNWNNYATHYKRGSCCIKEEYMHEGTQRTHWIIDKDIPIFKGEGRNYIDKLIEVAV